jgi:hypothetical protein
MESKCFYILRNDCEINDFPFALSAVCMPGRGGNFTYFMKGYLRLYNYKMPCAHHTYTEGKTGAASALAMSFVSCGYTCAE